MPVQGSWRARVPTPERAAMTVRIAQFVHASNDVVDEVFLRDFPEIEAAKADSLESLVIALDGAEILHVYNSAFTPEFARLVREKGRAPQVDPVHHRRHRYRAEGGAARGCLGHEFRRRQPAGAGRPRHGPDAGRHAQLSPLRVHARATSLVEARDVRPHDRARGSAHGDPRHGPHRRARSGISPTC